MRYHGNWKRQYYERCDVQVQSKHSSTAPVSSTSIPETIDDGEESERVSRMVERDNLVRRLGVIQLVDQLVKSLPVSDKGGSREVTAGGGGGLKDETPKALRYETRRRRGGGGEPNTILAHFYHHRSLLVGLSRCSNKKVRGTFFGSFFSSLGEVGMI